MSRASSVRRPAASETGISVRGLCKRFGDVTALDAIDLDVAAGEIVTLLGRNGAGKSTLLRILGTTVLPDDGTATVAGCDVVRDSQAARASTGFVLGDERSWYWRLSGRANLEFFGALSGLDRSTARREASAILTSLHLDDVADQRFDAYSSGMRARLSIGRAFLAEPRVLLLDEPTRTLDPVVAVQVRDLVTGLARDRELAVLWVTHDLHEACATSDRVVLLAAGQIAAEQVTPSDPAELHALFHQLAADVDPQPAV